MAAPTHFYVDTVPQHGLTQGIGTIIKERHLVLVAVGSGKTEAVHQLVEGPISAMWPATILQVDPHGRVALGVGATGCSNNTVGCPFGQFGSDPR